MFVLGRSFSSLPLGTLAGTVASGDSLNHNFKCTWLELKGIIARKGEMEIKTDVDMERKDQSCLLFTFIRYVIARLKKFNRILEKNRNDFAKKKTGYYFYLHAYTK